MSQNVTKTNDSLTVISVKHLSMMVQDLEQGDKCAKKLLLVENNLNLCNIKNQQLDSLLLIADTKETLYKENMDSYESIISAKDKQIQTLKKSKKLIIIGSIATVILSILF